ncbi:MAG: glycoside hydrolase family 95 protein, partial [Planctomycetota bacterium]
MLTLWYGKPADKWMQALPVGNGRLGAMVFGGVRRERLQLNEDTLWAGGPHCYDNPDALENLPKVRGLIASRRYDEAERAAQKLLGVPKYQQCYLPLGDIELRFPHEGEHEDYRRELDLETGIARVTYRVGDATFTREVFSSHPDQVIVVRLACDVPGQVSCDVSLKSPHPGSTRPLADDVLSLSGKVGPREGSRLISAWRGDGLAYEARVRVDAERGSVARAGDGIAVRDADAVTLVCASATSF